MVIKRLKIVIVDCLLGVCRQPWHFTSSLLFIVLVKLRLSESLTPDLR